MRILGVIGSSYYVPPFDYTSIDTNGVVTTSTDGLTWTFLKAFAKNQTNAGPNFTAKGLYYINNTFFARTGPMNKSTDGITWEAIESNNANFSSMIYVSPKYYKSNTPQIASSTDAITWEYLTLPITLTSSTYIAYGNSTFAVVNSQTAGANSLTSTDGVTWTSRTFVSVTDLILNSLKYLNNLFIAVGSYDIVSPATNNVAFLATSTDGITWTQRTVGGLGEASAINSITYGNGYYVVAVNTQTAHYSTDAITWSDTSTASNLQDITYGSAAGFYGQSGGTTYHKSTDGITWSSGTVANIGNSSARSTLYNSGTYYLGTIWSSTNNTNWYTSTDLVTFTAQTSNPPKGAVYYNSLKKTNGYYFAYGNINTNSFTALTFSYSTDAITWTDVTPTMQSGTTDLYQLAYGNGTYAIFGDTGYYSTSTDLVTWTTRTAWNTTFPRGNVLYADGKFIAYSSSGVIKTSTDAVTWTSRTSNVINTLSDIVYGNNTFIVIGNSGTITTSTDGITWTSRTSNVTTSLNRIAYGNGQYITTSSAGNITTSTDAVTWTSRNTGFTTTLQAVYYDGSKWVVGSATTTLGIAAQAESTDGITWTIQGRNNRTTGVNIYTAIVQ